MNILSFMSGSSLDGMDIGIIEISQLDESFSYSILKAETIPYNDFWAKALKKVHTLSSEELIRYDFAYGQYCGDILNAFLKNNRIKVDAISFHGHTIFHNPSEGYTYALGNLAALQTKTEKKVIGRFRDMDVAKGGQGAPLMAIADQLLFSEYAINVNLGGICNISTHGKDKIAYDVSPCNQLYNRIYQRMGILYDDSGLQAREGNMLHHLLQELNDDPYYKLHYPKSLDNSYIKSNFNKHLKKQYAPVDLLRTITEHVAHQLTISIVELLQNGNLRNGDCILFTGGGAHNDFLIERIMQKLKPYNIIYNKAESNLIDFKELILMALLAFLKMEDEVNILSAYTGAIRNSISGGTYG